MLLQRRGRLNYYTKCFTIIIFFITSYITLLYKRQDVSRSTPNLNKALPSYDIEVFLEKTRSKIKYQFNWYNFSNSGARGLQDLVVELGGRPMQTIIISTWRSGTTFLGQLLNSVPGTYYHYEPLIQYGAVQIRGPPEAPKALESITNMLKCNYKELKSYIEFGNKNLIQFRHNTRLWEHCKFMKKLCDDIEFTTRLCKLFPFHAMKTVRIRLRLVPKLLDDNELNVKVILLIRDPRGVIESRKKREFCKNIPECIDPSVICADMISDYVAAGQILRQYPGRLIVLRYEELALTPYMTSHRLLKFLKLSATQSVDEFLQWHTGIEVLEPGVSSTFRVSRELPFRWKKGLTFNDVRDIQASCRKAMILWGYKMAHNETHMKSDNFKPVEHYIIS